MPKRAYGRNWRADDDAIRADIAHIACEARWRTPELLRPVAAKVQVGLQADYAR
jgi:hypothetical protein